MNKSFGRKFLIGNAIFAILCVCRTNAQSPTPTPAGPQYVAIDIGPGSAAAINNNFAVIGDTAFTFDNRGRTNGYLWQNGVQTIVPNGFSMRGINDSGVMVGAFITSDGQFTSSAGQIWTSPTASAQQLVTLNPHPRDPSNPDTIIVDNPFRINNSGIILASDGFNDALVGTNGNFIIAPLDLVYSINNNGAIAGAIGNFAAVVTPFTGTQTLGTLPSPFNSNSTCVDINDNGDVVGDSYPNGLGDRAFFWRNTGNPADPIVLTDLGPLESAQYVQPFAINNKDQIVGLAYTDFNIDYQQARGVYWENGNLYDLTSLVANAQGIQISRPVDINDSGAIAASGFAADGSNHAYFLLPVNIVVRKQGEQVPQPGTGVLVKQGDQLEIALSDGWLGKTAQFQNMISWQWRQINGDGTFGAWQPFGPSENGTTFVDGTISSTAGIYQIKVIVSTGGQNQEFNYVRKVDDPNGADSNGRFNDVYRKGQPDYVGVAIDDTAISIVKAARLRLGSTAWREGDPITLPNGFVVGASLPKCNIFNYQVINSIKSIPTDAAGSPPRAYNWWDSTFAIAGWTFHPTAFSPSPGPVVARYKFVYFGIPVHVPHLGLHAHCGILDYDGAWINAGTETVNRFPHLTTPDYNFNPHFRN